jgi:hypothetical protein
MSGEASNLNINHAAVAPSSTDTLLVKTLSADCGSALHACWHPIFFSRASSH